LIVILSKRFCAAKDLREPREASRFLRRNNRASGSPPYQTAHHLIDFVFLRDLRESFAHFAVKGFSSTKSGHLDVRPRHSALPPKALPSHFGTNFATFPELCDV
jgi:hypothetical protein